MYRIVSQIANRLIRRQTDWVSALFRSVWLYFEIRPFSVPLQDSACWHLPSVIFQDTTCIDKCGHGVARAQQSVGLSYEVVMDVGPQLGCKHGEVPLINVCLR